MKKRQLHIGSVAADDELSKNSFLREIQKSNFIKKISLLSPPMSTRLIKRIEACFDRIAPKFLADDTWDNVGVIVESPLECGPNVLLTIDYGEEVFKEAVEQRAGVVVAYHPPWFKSCKRL